MDSPIKTPDQSPNGIVRRVVHRGVDVFVIDYTKTTTAAERMAALEETADFVRAYDGKANSVSDVRGVPADFAFARRSYQLGKELFTPKSLRSAITGISGIKKSLFQAYCLFSRANMRAFDTMDEALDYVVRPLDD
ncbi:MAG TPA: hypothetical protein PLF40_10790 [Kofleriaceae bacterium]|nr:hypothetical protein [Kofleriaceae bacterium]